MGVALQRSLIESGPDIEGFLYREGYITPDEEIGLLERIRSLDFQAMKMRGVARRRRGRR